MHGSIEIMHLFGLSDPTFLNFTILLSFSNIKNFYSKICYIRQVYVKNRPKLIFFINRITVRVASLGSITLNLRD